jgi:hypothetical protein
MNPSVWGPSLWTSLIYIVNVYPENDPTEKERADFLKFFQSLGPVLPCHMCRDNYTKDFDLTEKHLESREKLLRWLLALYNRSSGPSVQNSQAHSKRDDSLGTFLRRYSILRKQNVLSESEKKALHKSNKKASKNIKKDKKRSDTSTYKPAKRR